MDSIFSKEFLTLAGGICLIVVPAIQVIKKLLNLSGISVYIFTFFLSAILSLYKFGQSPAPVFYILLTFVVTFMACGGKSWIDRLAERTGGR